MNIRTFVVCDIVNTRFLRPFSVITEITTKSPQKLYNRSFFGPFFTPKSFFSLLKSFWPQVLKTRFHLCKHWRMRKYVIIEISLKIWTPSHLQLMRTCVLFFTESVRTLRGPVENSSCSLASLSSGVMSALLAILIGDSCSEIMDNGHMYVVTHQMQLKCKNMWFNINFSLLSWYTKYRLCIYVLQFVSVVNVWCGGARCRQTGLVWTLLKILCRTGNG